MKQKPKLNGDVEKIYPHYGSMMMTCSKSSTVKTTRICPIKDCNFTTRYWASEWKLRDVQKHSVGCKLCPTHQVPLLDIGMVMRLPKHGNRREKFLKELRSAEIIKKRNNK